MLETSLKNATRIVLLLLAAYMVGAAHELLRHPEYIGQWEAQKEVAFDQVWQKYAQNCNCVGD